MRTNGLFSTKMASFLTFIFLVFSLNLNAQTKKLTINEDCCMMREGKMMVMKNGKTMQMKKTMLMKNGTKCMVNGECIMRDGSKMQMKEGYCMEMSGKMCRRKNKN